MTLTNALYVLLCLGGLYCLHRVACWAEDRGWIYYRRSRGRSGSLGAAMLEAQSALQPSARHVIEERKRVESSAEETGEGLED